jgi:hypothetical protein
MAELIRRAVLQYHKKKAGRASLSGLPRGTIPTELGQSAALSGQRLSSTKKEEQSEILASYLASPGSVTGRWPKLTYSFVFFASGATPMQPASNKYNDSQIPEAQASFLI